MEILFAGKGKSVGAKRLEWKARPGAGIRGCGDTPKKINTKNLG